MYDYTQDNLSLDTTCQTCLALDMKCDECLEVSEARVSNIAHELVDENSDIYRYAPMYTPLLKLSDNPSGHDWTDREGEFMEPIVKLQDGGTLDNLELLEDYAQSKREQECHWCHLLTPKMYNDCQVCDKPLEHNLITAK